MGLETPIQSKRPFLIGIGGESLTGKSFTAKNIVNFSRETLRFTIFDSDQTRSIMVKKGILTPPLYTEEKKQMVYNEMLENVYNELLRKGNCIITTTFIKRDLRKRAMQLAENLEINYLMLRLKFSPELSEEELLRILNQRYEQKRSDPNNKSEGTPVIYFKGRQEFEPFDDKEKPFLIELNANEQITYETYQQIIGALNGIKHKSLKTF